MDSVKKLFFPIGGGLNFEERIYGALVVAKQLNAHIKFIAFQMDLGLVYDMQMVMKGGAVFNAFKDTMLAELNDEKQKNQDIFESLCKKVDIKISDKNIANETTAEFETKQGVRSKMVEFESKYCDLLVVACPPNGDITATFEAAVMKSGKSSIVIPRELKEFKADNILIAWSGTINISRAVTQAMFLLKQAKRVHIISTSKYLSVAPNAKENLLEYLAFHGVNATFEEVVPTNTPGEALLNNAVKGNFDMVIASSSGENGLKEMSLGGTTKYFLQNTKIPVFM